MSFFSYCPQECFKDSNSLGTFGADRKTRLETTDFGKNVVMKSNENSVGVWPIITALA